jgi:hypothetical protein
MAHSVDKSLNFSCLVAEGVLLEPPDDSIMMALLILLVGAKEGQRPKPLVVVVMMGGCCTIRWSSRRLVAVRLHTCKVRERKKATLA